jgi:hypothetical protein
MENGKMENIKYYTWYDLNNKIINKMKTQNYIPHYRNSTKI